MNGKKENAQARNRTGGPTMATLDFTTKPLALVLVGNICWKIRTIASISKFNQNSIHPPYVVINSRICLVICYPLSISAKFVNYSVYQARCKGEM